MLVPILINKDVLEVSYNDFKCNLFCKIPFE